MAKTYTRTDAMTFVEDMRAAGFKVEHYHGRYSWQGPAVRTSDDFDGPDLQTVIRATTVELQWDSMGMNEIVYPVQRDPGEGEEDWDDEEGDD